MVRRLCPWLAGTHPAHQKIPSEFEASLFPAPPAHPELRHLTAALREYFSQSREDCPQTPQPQKTLQKESLPPVASYVPLQSVPFAVAVYPFSSEAPAIPFASPSVLFAAAFSDAPAQAFPSVIRCRCDPEFFPLHCVFPGRREPLRIP